MHGIQKGFITIVADCSINEVTLEVVVAVLVNVRLDHVWVEWATVYGSLLLVFGALLSGFLLVLIKYHHILLVLAVLIGRVCILLLSLASVGANFALDLLVLVLSNVFRDPFLQGQLHLILADQILLHLRSRWGSRNLNGLWWVHRSRRPLHFTCQGMSVKSTASSRTCTWWRLSALKNVHLWVILAARWADYLRDLLKLLVSLEFCKGLALLLELCYVDTHNFFGSRALINFQTHLLPQFSLLE